MPRYEYRCRTCAATFELRRTMAEANDPATCPAGHADSTRLLSVFASVGGSDQAPAGASAPMSGGGCGAGCACAHG